MVDSVSKGTITRRVLVRPTDSLARGATLSDLINHPGETVVLPTRETETSNSVDLNRLYRECVFQSRVKPGSKGVIHP